MEQYNENALDMFSNIKKELEEMLKNVHTDPRVDMFQDVYRKEIEVIEECETALEKQIPKKVIEQTENDREFIDYVCPNCKTTLQQKNKQAKRITVYKYKHCIDCGQALDWGDSE